MAEPNRKGANPALRLALIRRLHTYVAVLIAPSLLLFGFTGTLQVFRIPDSSPSPLIQKLASVHKNQTFEANPKRGPGGPGGRGGAGGPRAGDDGDRGASSGDAPIQSMPQAVNGDAAQRSPDRGEGPQQGAAAPAQAQGPQAPAGARAGPPPPKASTQALKWFAAAVGVGLVISTLLGLWMALIYNREKKRLWALFVIGLAIPALLLAL